MRSQAFFERDDTFALGVCNGCQMMCNLRRLIPGAEFWPHFVRNRSEQFEARVAMVKFRSRSRSSCRAWPVRACRSPSLTAKVMPNSRSKGDAGRSLVAMRFVDNHGKVTERYPANPNGSPRRASPVTSRMAA